MATRTGLFQRATALVPLALLSTAVTASLAGAGSSAVADQRPASALPDGSTVPTEAIEAPASVSQPGVVAPGVKGGFDDAVASASASGIPAAALAAYQRAETVINAADRSCNLPWQLVAAIGRVESDHGRANGNSLDDDGLATPGIFGIPLDGSNDTAVIRDTDAGQYDADAKWDRAVGPMQFIPSTWSVVGVDGDNDGERNPQDVDDAALATAVYLCSGDDDLSTDPGLRSSVFRYNHSQEYVDLVLSFMESYLTGDFTSVPNGTSSSGFFAPSPEPVRPAEPRKDKPNTTPVRDFGGSGGNGGGGGGTNTAAQDDEVVAPPSGGDGGGDKDPVEQVKPPEPPKLPEVDDALTEKEASAKCLAKVGGDSVTSLDPLKLADYKDCMAGLGF